MTPKTREDYDLDVGLIDDFDGIITTAYFSGARDEYAAAAGGSTDPNLFLVIETPDLEKPIEQMYSCGAAKQWQVGRGGSEITSAKTPDSHRFNMSARAGILVTRMFELVGNSDKVKGQDFFIKRDRYMTEGEFYDGLSFHWKRERLTTVSGEGSDALMPNRYLGEVAPGKTATVTATPAAPTEDLDKVVIDMIAKASKDGSPLDERGVKMAAMKKDELKANEAYMKELVSGGKLKELEAAGKIAAGPDGKYI